VQRRDQIGRQVAAGLDTPRRRRDDRRQRSGIGEAIGFYPLVQAAIICKKWTRRNIKIGSNSTSKPQPKPPMILCWALRRHRNGRLYVPARLRQVA
jgi:hypothetical protein